MSKGSKDKLLWTIIKKNVIQGKHPKSLCKCICGKEVLVQTYSIGKESFGCQKCMSARKKHGKSNTPIYKRWNNMISRCYQPLNPQYGDYGGRGISVCDEWKNNFESYESWCLLNGYKKGLSVDRINNNDGYKPENCRMTTPIVQIMNRRTTIKINDNGKTIKFADWVRDNNFNYAKAYYFFSRRKMNINEIYRELSK